MSDGNLDNADRLSSIRIRKLKIVIVITLAYLFVQVIFGFITGSLALLADAGHMFTDVGGLAMSLFAMVYSRKPSTAKHTYGYYRTEILATLVNCLILILLSIFITYEAYHRITNPQLEVLGFPMLVVAFIGLILNLTSMKILKNHNHSHLHNHHIHTHLEKKQNSLENKNSAQKIQSSEKNAKTNPLDHTINKFRRKKWIFNLTSPLKKDYADDENLNMQGASLEVLSDTLGSIGVMVAAIIIQTTQFAIVDPLVSIGLALFILPRTWSLLKKAIHILLEGAPANISYEEVKNTILQIKGITGIFDLRIWSITSGMHALSAHVIIMDMAKSQFILKEINALLENKFGITNTTIQIELYHV